MQLVPISSKSRKFLWYCPKIMAEMHASHHLPFGFSQNHWGGAAHSFGFQLGECGKVGKYVDKIKIMLSYPMLFFWKYIEKFQFIICFHLAGFAWGKAGQICESSSCHTCVPLRTKDGKDRPTHRPQIQPKNSRSCRGWAMSFRCIFHHMKHLGCRQQLETA